MMKVTFDYLDDFSRRAKVLRKKYSSFESDYNTFLDELEANPLTLLTIYDKSEIENVSDSYLRSLVQQLEHKKKH